MGLVDRIVLLISDNSIGWEILCKLEGGLVLGEIFVSWASGWIELKSFLNTLTIFSNVMESKTTFCRMIRILFLWRILLI